MVCLGGAAAKANSATAGPSVASLFSGCGGFDLGFLQQGFRPIGAFDIDPQVVEVYNENVKPVASVHDLTKCTPQVKPDVLLAGSPCQGFSTAGKRKVDDPRNDLLLRAGQIAVAIRPRIFVLENVPAAMSGQHGTRWEQVEAMLRDVGYRVASIVAKGPSCGVPQFRKRLFLLAWIGNDCTRWKPSVGQTPSLADALRDVSGLSGHDPKILPSGSREQKIARRIAPGQKLCNVRSSPAAVPTWNIPEVFGEVTAAERTVLTAVSRLRRRARRRKFGDADPVLPSVVSRHLNRCCHSEIRRLLHAKYLRRIGKYIDLRHTYNGKYRRLPRTGISPTVDTHFGDPTLFIHPRFDRGMTPREAARLQGFSDEFVLRSSRSRAFRMIGNAVPPPMAAHLAAYIREAILASEP